MSEQNWEAMYAEVTPWAEWKSDGLIIQLMRSAIQREGSTTYRVRVPNPHPFGVMDFDVTIPSNFETDKMRAIINEKARKLAREKWKR